ncbi:glutathione S-transferase [bacterium]|nr:glutathione S-transferase [bacterium]
MRFYNSPTTPFGRKVAVLLREIGLKDKVDVVEVSGTPVAPGTMPVDRNPLGKIPLLERDDGKAIYDSRVICRYLDDLTGAGLYGAAPKLWDVLTLEATADGMLDAAVLMVYEARLRPPEIQFPDWLEGQWAKIARALDALETSWIDHLNGPLDMGHIAVGCGLGYLDFRHAARDWRAGHPRLAEWEARFAQRPAMKATAPA